MAEEKKSTPAQGTPSSTEQSQEVKISDIHNLPGFMVRKRIDKDLGGLVQSIKSQGVIEPVILRLRAEGDYQMVSGYRRMWAAEMAGRDKIPSIIYDMTLEEARQYARESNGTQKPPIPGKPVVVPSREAPATPTAGKVSEDKTTTGEKSTAPSKADIATPAADKVSEDKTAITGESSTVPGEETAEKPAADKLPEPGETGRVPLSQVYAPKNKEAF